MEIRVFFPLASRNVVTVTVTSRSTIACWRTIFNGHWLNSLLGLVLVVYSFNWICAKTKVKCLGDWVLIDPKRFGQSTCGPVSIAEWMISFSFFLALDGNFRYRKWQCNSFNHRWPIMITGNYKPFSHPSPISCWPIPIQCRHAHFLFRFISKSHFDRHKHENMMSFR